jgi:hypothetical protein
MDRRVDDRREAVLEERAAAIANVQLPSPDVPASAWQESGLSAQIARETEQDQPFRASTGIFRDESVRTTSIGGPSFLGLSDDSRQGEYLLEDEGSSGGVLRKLVLLAILAAIGGLVFMQWRSNSGLFANPKLPEPPKIASPTLPSPLPTPQAEHKDDGPPSSEDSSRAADTKRSSKDDGPAISQDSSRSAGTKGSSSGALDATVAGGEEHAGSRSHERKKTTEDTSSDGSPSPALVRAQDFLFGRNGVKQNCEQGLVYLRTATKANDPAAAMQMGTLYTSGHCVTRDRVMAYRWFNSAHELQPDNPEIRSGIAQLWAQMTPQERRQAGR